jgi:hypothetical protein
MNDVISQPTHCLPKLAYDGIKTFLGADTVEPKITVRNPIPLVMHIDGLNDLSGSYFYSKL